MQLRYRVLADTPGAGIAHWHVSYQVASEELFEIWARSAGTNLVARRPGDPLPRMILDGVLQGASRRPVPGLPALVAQHDRTRPLRDAQLNSGGGYPDPSARPPMRIVTLVLMVALVDQRRTLVRQGGLPRKLELETALQAQRADNDAKRARNEKLAAEVRDLRKGWRWSRRRRATNSAWSSPTRSWSRSRPSPE